MTTLQYKIVQRRFQHDIYKPRYLQATIFTQLLILDHETNYSILLRWALSIDVIVKRKSRKMQTNKKGKIREKGECN